MDWLFKFIIIWLSLDIVIIATGWYFVYTIRPVFPDWWRRVIVDETTEIA